MWIRVGQQNSATCDAHSYATFRVLNVVPDVKSPKAASIGHLSFVKAGEDSMHRSHNGRGAAYGASPFEWR
jgi:hypothetical protein